MTELDDIRESLDASRRAAIAHDHREQVRHLREALAAVLALDDRLRVRVTEAGRSCGRHDLATRSTTQLNDSRIQLENLRENLDGSFAVSADSDGACQRV